MALFLIVPKVILLKILFCSISVLGAYEYGYHPSAEEFDNLMRETRKTWTGDLLANERRRADTWTHHVSPKRRFVGAEAVYSFLPKYKKHIEPNRYATTTPFNWPNPFAAQQTQVAPEMNDRNDQQIESTNLEGPNQIGSSLGFSMFGGEEQPSGHEHQSEENQPILLTETNVFSGQLVRNATTTRSPFIYNKVPPGASHSKNDTLSTHVHNLPFSETGNSSSYPTPIFYSNQSVSQLPIFFTNPATGIVYAITEVGKVQDNATLSNDSIPIYITKQQYDRDLFLLKKHYERRCQAQKLHTNSSNNSVISTSNSSTMRPQIIRLKKPPASYSVSKLPTAKTSKPIHQKPPQVIVQAALDVGNHVNLPTQKRKPKIPKRKKKKQKKSPGRKPITNGPATQITPEVILGTRLTEKPTASVDRVPTQLEKPASMPMTIFSSRPIVSVKKSIMPPPQHTIRRRSLTNAGVLDSRFRGKAFFREDKEVGVPETTNFEVHKAKTTTLSPTTTTAFARVAFLAPAATAKNAERPLKATARAAKRSTTQRPRTSATKKRKKPKKKFKATDDYDLFGLYADEDDYDDDDDEEDEEEELVHETENESLEIEPNDVHSVNDIRKNFHINPKPSISAKPYSTAKPFSMPRPQNDAKPHQQMSQTHKKPAFNVPQNNVQYQNSFSGTSSAEPEADYGALYESPEIIASSTEEQKNKGSYTKHPSSKKRTRRRPSSQKVQYYYDDYAEDDADNGIGSFFSMIFYPVQVVMDKIFESYSQKDASYSSSEESQVMPTYTLYNNVAQKGESFEHDDEQGNSLSDWFISWFGFNRRTKKISSTTAAPLPPPPAPLPTEAPGWFDSWFGYGSGKTTTEASYEDYDDDKWFFNWFDTKSKSKRRRDTTTTTTTTLPQVPILTIVDPLRNPQNWIGILAHHIINSTETSTHNPLIEAFTRATTTTTTENPDIPRKINYEKYQIWRLRPQDATQVQTLEEYKKSDEGVKLQWLKGPSLRGLNDVLVPPKMLFDFQATLNFESIAHEILIFDVGKAIAYEKSKEQYLYTTTHRPNKHHRNPPLAMSWNNYYEYDEIIKYLESIRLRHPQMIELIHIGRSYEGRPLIIVKIESKQTSAATAASLASHKKLKFKKKSGHANAVFIEAGTHGLEWIGPATSTWMINELLRIMKSNKTDVDLDFVKNTTWYILPVLNPDGYVYTHEYDRFWKKSRSRHISRPGGLITSAMTWLQQRKVPEKVCYGVDLDRNWHYLWGRRGSSKSPCNEFYAGPVPFSEPETKALSEFLMDYRKQIKLYISLQAYGQVLSYPNKANSSFNSEKMDDFLDVALVSTDGLRKKGSKSRYKIDSTNDLMENRAGCSDAFAAYEVGIPFSYTLQLADNGVHGYLLPSSSIESTARDAFEIITAMIDYI